MAEAIFDGLREIEGSSPGGVAALRRGRAALKMTKQGAKIVRPLCPLAAYAA
jgi:hypothetical protein